MAPSCNQNVSSRSPPTQAEVQDEILPIFGNTSNRGINLEEFETSRRLAHEKASKYLGKFQFGSDGIEVDILPPPLSIPPRRHDECCSPEPPPPPFFLEAIEEILLSTPPTLKAPLLSFNTDKKALKQNDFILQHFDYDINKMMTLLAPGTQLELGSEFRKPSILQPLLQYHANWKVFEETLLNGADFPMEPLEESVRQQDLEEGLQHGNHKGAASQPDLLEKLLSKDITHGRALPISIESASKIKGGIFSPLNIQDQFSINEKGERIPKPRMTHNQSFPGLISGTSINSRLLSDEVPPLIYGNMFRRHIHMVHAMRYHYPGIHILQAKFDWDAAYRRVHLSWKMVAACICLAAQFALIFLRLTFGGAACPPFWCNGAEMITDLAIDIINCSAWDPEKLKANFSDQELPEPVLLDESIPFHIALPADVSVNIPRYGTADDYIDDICTLCLHIGNNWRRTSAGVLLALYLVARPEDKNDPIPRNPVISLRKWIAEGTPEETKVILGWVVNTRTLRVSLPDCRVLEWSNQITHLLEKGKAHKNTWNKILGRLTRLSEIIPTSRFFLNRIRTSTAIAEKQQWCSLTDPVRKDLELWLYFLKKSEKGFSINNLIFRRPSRITWSDSFPGGMGGYTASGKAWRFQIPPHLRCDNVNNILEFLAAFITTWLDIFYGDAPPESCFLSCTDSSSTVGWLHRNNFDSDIQPIHEEISRKLASILIDNECCLYSQHHKGKRNVIADLLSHALKLSDPSFTNGGILLGYLTAAESERAKSVTTKTQSDQSTAWSHWCSFLRRFGLGTDPFLVHFDRQARTRLLGSFAVALRRAEFTRRNQSSLVGSSVQKTIGQVAKTFREHDAPDPRLDQDGNESIYLQQIIKGMKSSDPPEKVQKALNHSVLLYLINNCEENSLFFTIGLLTLAALFFACRSCEYSKVNGERKTKLLQVQDIVFRQGQTIITSKSYNILSSATTVSITFRDQKNNEKFETITQHRSSHDQLCPVKLWASIIARIHTIPGSNKFSPVSLFQNPHSKEVFSISSTQVLKTIRWAVDQIGEEILGYSSSEIGTHSIRSGGAMAMYLSGVPIVTIMLIGRWKSDAFVRYIRKQVLEFTAGVSEKMSKLNNFYTIPENINQESQLNPRHQPSLMGDQLQHELSSIQLKFENIEI